METPLVVVLHVSAGGVARLTRRPGGRVSAGRGKRVRLARVPTADPTVAGGASARNAQRRGLARGGRDLVSAPGGDRRSTGRTHRGGTTAVVAVTVDRHSAGPVPGAAFSAPPGSRGRSPTRLEQADPWSPAPVAGRPVRRPIPHPASVGPVRTRTIQIAGYHDSIADPRLTCAGDPPCRALSGACSISMAPG